MIRRTAPVAAAVALAVFAGWILLGVGGPAGVQAFDNLGLVLIAWGTAGACVARAVAGGQPGRSPWLPIGAGVASWGLGQAVWSHYELVAREQVPFPSAADVGYLLLIPLVTIGLLRFLRGEGEAAQARLRFMLDGAIIALAVFSISWTFALARIYEGASGTALQTVIGLAYPIGDVAIITVATSVFIHHRSTERDALLLLVLGFVAWAVADTSFALLTTLGAYQTGNPIDILWAAGFLLVLVAASRPSGTPAPPAVVAVATEPLARFLPYMVVAFALSAAAPQIIRGPVDMVQVWDALAIFLLISVRQVVALNEMGRLGRDIRRVNDALAAAQQRLENAQHIARIGSWEWRIPSDTVHWSDELYRLFGFAPGAIGVDYQRYLDCVHPEDRALVEAAIQGALRAGGPFVFEHRVVHPDGEVRWIHSTGEVRIGPSGAPERMAGTAQDITDRRESELRVQEIESLRSMSQFKTQFINMAAHELNTPLTPLKLQLHMLRSDQLGVLSQEQRHALELMGRNLERVEALVTNMLDVARIQSGRIVLRREATDLHGLLDQAVQSFQPVARHAGLRLALDVRGDHWLMADAQRIHQVLFNLLSNAIKFTPAGGSILVRARRQGAESIVEVQDSGAGLAADEIPMLFHPFSQVHVGRQTSGHPGSGLGLYISRQFIELHGGRIFASSLGRGKGAVFTFTLPHVPAAPQASGPHPEPSPAEAGLVFSAT